MRRREREWTGWAAGLAAGLVWIVFVVALGLAVYGLFDRIIDSMCGTGEPEKVERHKTPGLVWMKGEEKTMKMKELKKGEWFTLKPIEKPMESQVFIRSDYDRSERKYWAIKWSDICDGKYVDGNREVYTDFEF